MTPEQRIAGGEARPFTGAEFLESLRDGREVYIDGERVADVTAHPAFRNAVRSLARLYDALHDPATKETLTLPDRYRLGRVHAPILSGCARARRAAEPAARDRRMVAT